MDEILNILWALFVFGIYLFLCHIVAKRGLMTGLYYNRVFILAVPFLLPVAIWVYSRPIRRHPWFPDRYV